MQVNIKNLIDDVQCYQTVRELHWPDGVACPSCESQHLIKRGFDFRYLQQHDRHNHRNDEHYHCHSQPDAPVFLVSHTLACLKFLISCASLGVPSDLLLLSGFLTLCHVLSPFPVRCGALHHEGALQPPPLLGQRMS